MTASSSEAVVVPVTDGDRDWVRVFLLREAGALRMNRPAIAFYRRQGLTLAAVHQGAVRRARFLKPEIPFYGVEGRPIEDEVEFERLL